MGGGRLRTRRKTLIRFTADISEERDHLDYQALIAYLEAGSFRKAGKAIGRSWWFAKKAIGRATLALKRAKVEAKTENVGM